MPECVLERVWEYAPFEDFHLPISGRSIVMEKQRNKVCGDDIHKKFLVATILSRDGTKLTKRFGMTLDDLLEFRAWVMENQCEQAAVESTGVYWIPIHAVLENSVDLIVANAYFNYWAILLHPYNNWGYATAIVSALCLSSPAGSIPLCAGHGWVDS